MKQMETLAVALMAGGRSTRMGRDKACLMDRKGREFWRGRLELLCQMGATEVFISCREDQGYLAESGAQLVFDQWENAGPMGGIVSCLEEMKADRLMVLAVDLPEMTRAGLTALLTAAGEGGAVFRCGRFLEPLVAVYPKAMAGSGRRRLEDGEFALLEWITKDGEVMRELQVPASEEALFMNVNDPAAWDRWITGEA